MSIRRAVLIAMVLAGALILAACVGGGEEAEPTPTVAAPTPTPTVTPVPPELERLCPKIDGEIVQAVVALLEIDKPQYVQGEPIEMTLRLVNCAGRPITRTFPDAQRYDFIVRKADAEEGEEVWRWSAGMAFAEVEGEETFQPGQQVTFTEIWEQVDSEGNPVEAGQYELVAESTGCDESLQNCGPRASRTIDIVLP